MRISDVAAHGVALVPVEALALLEVDGIARKVPVHQAMAPRVEVATLSSTA